MAFTKVSPSSPTAAKQCCDNPVVKKRVRAVSINLSKNVVYENTHWTHRESKLTWYSPAEFKVMKNDTIDVARSLMKRENELAEIDEASYLNVILNVYRICMDADSEKSTKLPKENKKLLKKTVRKWHSRTGLEKLCISEIGQDKRRRRLQLANAVLDEQDENMDKSANERAELMRVASRKLSRASRLFARHMAAASRVEE